MRLVYVIAGERRERDVESVEEAVRLYEADRDAEGVGASDLSCGYVSEDGRQVARISYNGRVWRDGVHPGGREEG